MYIIRCTILSYTEFETMVKELLNLPWFNMKDELSFTNYGSSDSLYFPKDSWNSKYNVTRALHWLQSLNENPAECLTEDLLNILIKMNRIEQTSILLINS